MTTRTSTVFLIDDHPLVREWLTTLINQLPDLRVCGEAAGAEQAFDGIRASRPDIAIVDLALPEGSGLALVKRITAEMPDVAVVVLSMHDECYYAERAFRAGARGYVMKGESTSSIAAAIRDVLAGRLYVSPRMQSIFSKRFGDDDLESLHAPVKKLSDRELEVFRLLGQGYETRRVAQSLNVSIKTVQAYCARIKEKLQLANASELLREAIRWNDAQSAG
ncbi:MAG TPA: response regulator transcription factor [Rhizomicrobium sp.]|jgi:DNA-binding NarL/FixJ family response regulator|nr:response regulator transcription factor [Rhizomicrobium sp.]